MRLIQCHIENFGKLHDVTIDFHEGLNRICQKNGWELYCPLLKYCGDNAAMVGSQAFYEAQQNTFADLNLNAYATMPIDNCQY